MDLSNFRGLRGSSILQELAIYPNVRKRTVFGALMTWSYVTKSALSIERKRVRSNLYYLDARERYGIKTCSSVGDRVVRIATPMVYKSI